MLSSDESMETSEGITRFLVLHGPNLNLLGLREPEIYGKMTLDEINKHVKNEADALNVDVSIQQSNHEGELVDYIQGAFGKIEGIIINPGAYTHTSVAIRDAVKGVGIPTVEVHLSNISARESFRAKSYISPVCVGQISGFGYLGYILALRGLVSRACEV